MPAAFRIQHTADAVLRAARSLRGLPSGVLLALLEDRDRQLEDYLTKTRVEANHAHPAAASSVTDDRTWDTAPIVGASTNYARQDHSHGLPAYPIPAGPHCEIQRTTSQEIVMNTDTTVGFDATFNANVDLRSGNSIVIQQAGRYLVWTCLKWALTYGDGNYGGYRSAHIAVNGDTLVDDHHFAPTAGPSGRITHNVSRVVQLAPGDVVTAQVLHFHDLTAANLFLLGGDTMHSFLGVCFQT